MDIDEAYLHQARKHIIHITGNLLNSRRGLFLSIKYAKLVGSLNPTCKAIEQNIDAMVEGMIETVKLCGIAADLFKQQMKDPDATPPPRSATYERIVLTPMQRQLALQGVKFDTMPEFVPNKTERRIAKILPFTPHTTKRKKQRRKSPDNPPL